MSLAVVGGLIARVRGLERADLRVEDGRVEFAPPRAADRVIDASGCVVAPAFVDLHTHLRWPGGLGPDTPEDIAEAALVGGFTTVVAMANTDPAIDRPVRYEQAVARFRDLPITVIQGAAATMEREGSHPVDVEQLAAAGVRLISDDGDPVARADVLVELFARAARAGVMVAQHASIPELSQGQMNASVLAERLGYDGVPESAETAMVARDVELARGIGVHYHVQHLSARESLNVVRVAKRDGLWVTCEVTPHHLALEDTLLTGHDARYKVNPPLRSRATRMALLEALLNGTIDAVATDHAPHPEWRKDVPLELAAPGVLGLVEAFSATWSAVLEQLQRRGDLDAGALDDGRELPDPAQQALLRVIEALGPRPAAVLGLEHRLEPGVTCDLVVIDPRGRVRGGGVGVYRSATSPWLGRELYGRIRWVVRAGRLVVEDGQRVDA